MTTPAIELRKVGKVFPSKSGPRAVLEGIDLTIQRGSFVTILGTSGCGKSTLMRLIAGLDHPSGGTVRVRGEAVVKPGADRGVVFQEPRLLPWRTVRQNVALGLVNSGHTAERHDALVAEHLALVGLEGFHDAYPYQLSGGMAQRVAIARALVARPEVLLLDEPFSALDPMTRAGLQDVLLDIWTREGLTVVMITHDVEEAVYLSDRIAVMRPEPGRIAASIDIDLPRPRDRDGFDFTAVRRQVSERLRGDPAPAEPFGASIIPLSGARPR